MNIAVISNQFSQSGQSSFVSLLASVYARTQQKRAALTTNGRLEDILKLNDVKKVSDITKSANVSRAIMGSAAVQDSEIWDYGYRIGEEEVFAFEDVTNNLSLDEKVEAFNTLLGRIHCSMTLIEVVGDINEPFNAKLLKDAHLVLYVFNHSPNSIAKVKDFLADYDKSVVAKTGFVCLKYDRNVVAEKILVQDLGIDANRLMQIPYNSVIPKECLNGTLNTLAKFIAKGHAEVINLRPKFLDIMKYLYNTKERKYIKEVSEW